MPIVQSKAMSHVALKVKDVDRQIAFYTDLAGFGLTCRDDRGNAYLRCNGNHHALTLIPASESGIDHYAISVGGPAGLDAAVDALTHAGIPHEDAPPEAGQGAAVRLRDPDGFVVELVAALEQRPPTYGARAVQPRKFGHLNLHVRNLKESADFYRDVLGFRLSDMLENVLLWMRCNPDHHGVAFASVGKQGLHHFALEVRSLGELTQQAEHLSRNQHRLVYGPGRHGPGDNLFVYFLDPEANMIEFTADVQQIWDDEAHVPRMWRMDEPCVNLWGPEPPAGFL